MLPSGTRSTWAERCELSPCFTHTRVDGISSPVGGKNKPKMGVLAEGDTLCIIALARVYTTCNCLRSPEMFF